MKRRKKSEDKPKGEAQAPLQPAYFDAEPAKAAPAEAETETAAPEPVSSSSEVPASQPESNGEAPRRKRRRRGRGGRGRSVKPAPAPLAEASIAETEPAVEQPAPEPQPVRAMAAPERLPAVASGKAPRGVVVLAIGLPGSGKSSWFKRHSITPLSSDLLRTLLFDDPQEQRFQDLVFSNLRSMLKARLIARRPMNYVDATNLSSHERHGWIKLAKDYGYEVQAVFFDVPLEVCMERNQRRGRKVPEDVMRRMSGKLRGPAFEEGFSKITVVKVKKKDGTAS